MKWILAILLVAAGTALGGVVAYYGDRDPGDDYQALLRMADEASGDVQLASSFENASPKVVVENGREFDFGVMDVSEERQHVFLVRNAGHIPLEMKLIRTTCKCAIGELPDGAIPPGEVGEVLLDWTAKDYAREFRQSATIETNDPNNRALILSVFGRVVQSVITYPSVVTLGDATNSDSRKATVSLQAYKDADLTIDSFEWIASEREEFFDVGWKEVEPRDEAVKAYDIEIGLKPGIPYGKIQENLLLKLSSAPGRVKLPVNGRIVSDIAIVGRNYREKTGTLRLGIVPQAKGATSQLLVLVKGPHRSSVEFEKSATDPSDLDVVIGESTTYETVVKYPIDIIVPPGAALTQRRASENEPGRIVLKTTHPEIKEVEILVSYAVQ